MALNAHLRYVLCFSVAAVLSYAQISDLRLCSDEHCNAQISEARTLIRYHSSDPRILSFQINSAVKIFSKSAGSNPDLWGAEISGKRGYVPKKFIREHKILIPKSDLKATVPTEGSSSAEKSPVESSWAQTVVTHGIETIATFTSEFPASFDQLSTNILRHMFTSAETLNIESVSAELIENVTLNSAESIEVSKSELPIVRPTESVREKAETTSTTSKLAETTSTRSNLAETTSNLAHLTCGTAETSTCTYSFGSVLARFATSKMAGGRGDEEINENLGGKMDLDEEDDEGDGVELEVTDQLSTDADSDDDDDEEFMDDEDEIVETPQVEFLQMERSKQVQKTIIEEEEKHVLTSSFTPEESTGSEFTEKLWKVTEKQMISTSLGVQPVETTHVSSAQKNPTSGEMSETSETPLQTLIPTSSSEEIEKEKTVSTSINRASDEKRTISALISEESDKKQTISTSINEENEENDEKQTISTSINEESDEEQTISTLINEENDEKQTTSMSINGGTEEKERISSSIDEKSVENDVSSAAEGPNNDETTESPLRILIPASKTDARTTSASTSASHAAPEDWIFALPFVGGDFELRKRIQFIIDFLPESVQLVLSDQKKMGVSPHATVLTSITAFFFLFFFSIYFLIKRGNKERVLIARLCNLDRKLFVVSAERDLLREKAEIAVEHEEKYAKMDESFSLVGEDLASAKQENCALSSRVENLQDEVAEYKNMSIRSAADSETKDKYLRELEEEHEIAEENVKTLQEHLSALQDELRLKSSMVDDTERRINALSEEKDELRESNKQLLQEAQVWNQRLLESQQQIELTTKTNDDLVKEIEILRDTATQLESLETETDPETKSKKLQMLFDVSAMSAQLKATSLNYAALQEDYDNKMNSCTLVQSRLDTLVAENELLRQRDAELKQERDEAVTKLHVLSDYFKGKEIELQKELGVQEAMRQQTEESALSVTEKADLYEKEVELHRSHIQALKKEMDNQVRSYKTQITVHESKSHENWLAARAAERRAEEAKQEAAMLRNKLTTLEHEAAANRSEIAETRLTPTRRDGDSNGQVNSPPPLMGHRIPFLPLDRPLPPPPPPRGGIGQHSPFLGDRLPRFDMPPPMMPYDFLPPMPGRRPPSPPMFNRRPPFGGPGPGPFRDLSPPRFYDRPNVAHKLPSEAQLSGSSRFPSSPYSGSRGAGSPPSDANTSV